jgi:hypothetical protein
VEEEEAMKTRNLVIAGVVLGIGALWVRGANAEQIDPYVPGPGGKGKIYGGNTKRRRGRGKAGGEPLEIPPGLPADFDFGGNKIWVSADCEFVVEGNLFWPTPGEMINAEEAETLEAVLAIEGNSVIGYVDVLIARDYTDPAVVAQQILQEVSPLCADLDPAMWGEGLLAWYENFVERLIPYLEEGGIEFDP